MGLFMWENSNPNTCFALLVDLVASAFSLKPSPLKLSSELAVLFLQGRTLPLHV